jgi:hypothetical protein
MSRDSHSGKGNEHTGLSDAFQHGFGRDKSGEARPQTGARLLNLPPAPAHRLGSLRRDQSGEARPQTGAMSLDVPQAPAHLLASSIRMTGDTRGHSEVEIADGDSADCQQAQQAEPVAYHGSGCPMDTDEHHSSIAAAGAVRRPPFGLGIHSGLVGDNREFFARMEDRQSAYETQALARLSAFETRAHARQASFETQALSRIREGLNTGSELARQDMQQHVVDIRQQHGLFCRQAQDIIDERVPLAVSAHLQAAPFWGRLTVIVTTSVTAQMGLSRANRLAENKETKAASKAAKDNAAAAAQQQHHAAQQQHHAMLHYNESQYGRFQPPPPHMPHIPHNMGPPFGGGFAPQGFRGGHSEGDFMGGDFTQHMHMVHPSSYESRHAQPPLGDSLEQMLSNHGSHNHQHRRDRPHEQRDQGRSVRPRTEASHGAGSVHHYTPTTAFTGQQPMQR